MSSGYDAVLAQVRTWSGRADHRPVFVERLLAIALIAVLSIVALDLVGDGFATAFDQILSGPGSTP